MSDFGKTIRAARLASQLSLRGLADKLELSASYLNDIEHDRRVPSEAVVAGLASALGLDIDQLLALAGRVGEAAEEYLKTNPSAGVMLRRASGAGLSEDELKGLIAQMDRMIDKRKSTEG